MSSSLRGEKRIMYDHFDDPSGFVAHSIIIALVLVLIVVLVSVTMYICCSQNKLIPIARRIPHINVYCGNRIFSDTLLFKEDSQTFETKSQIFFKDECYYKKVGLSEKLWFYVWESDKDKYHDIIDEKN